MTVLTLTTGMVAITVKRMTSSQHGSPARMMDWVIHWVGTVTLSALQMVTRSSEKRLIITEAHTRSLCAEVVPTAPTTVNLAAILVTR